MMFFAKQTELPAPSNINGFKSARLFVLQHAVLSYEYSVLRARIAQVIKARPLDKSLANHLILQAKESAQCLEIIYANFIYVPREILNLKREQAIYGAFLKKNGLCPSNKQFRSVAGIESLVQDATAALNAPRLISTRSRNFLLFIRRLTSEGTAYHQWVTNANNKASPFFSYMGWMFFIPRFVVNVGAVIQYTLPGGWLNAKAREFSWNTRLYFAWSQRWFQIGSDPTRVISGLINCFILTGNLAPWSVYTTLAIQVFDVTWGLIRLALELEKINALEAEYQNQLESTPEKSASIQAKMKCLEALKDYTIKRLSANVLIDFALLIVVGFMLPTFNLPAIVPVIAAATSLFITFSSIYITRLIEQSKPETNISNLVQFGLFTTIESDHQPETDSSHSIELVA